MSNRGDSLNRAIAGSEAWSVEDHGYYQEEWVAVCYDPQWIAEAICKHLRLRWDMLQGEGSDLTLTDDVDVQAEIAEAIATLLEASYIK